MTRLACDDFGWPGLRPEFVFDLIREMDLEGVSLGFFGGATPRDPQLIASDPEGWAERIGGELAARDLAAADAFFVPSGDLVRAAVNHPDPAQVEEGEAL